jgi:hypothetical protein
MDPYVRCMFCIGSGLTNILLCQRQMYAHPQYASGGSRTGGTAGGSPLCDTAAAVVVA